MKKQDISLIMVVHNEEKIIKRALDSAKDVVDDILILHDGPCSDKTLDICKKYTKKVYATKKNTGLPGPILPLLFRRVRTEWILKIDADEFLSQEMKKNIRKLVKNKEADAYTFRWPFWNGEKYVTKNWPRKPSLYRRSKISYFGFPHWDDPKINGKVMHTDFQLEHRPKLKYPPFSWEDFVKRGLKRYGLIQAAYSLNDFDSFDKFQYNRTDFPLQLKIRRRFPLLSAIPFSILAFFKLLISGRAWKEGKYVFIEAGHTIIYYFYVGYLIYKFKKIKPYPGAKEVLEGKI